MFRRSLIRLARRAVKRSPLLFSIRYRLSRGYKKILVRANTDLMIEGFPRSGNTYTVWAFQLANPKLRFANHMHSAAHVRLAVLANKPTLVLIREPEAAVRSLLLRRDDMTFFNALEDYIDFYCGIEALLPKLLLVRFESATENIASVVAAVNKRFNVSLSVPDQATLREDVMQNIDRENREFNGGVLDLDGVSMPRNGRDQLKAGLSMTGCESLLADAKKIYTRLLPRAI